MGRARHACAWVGLAAGLLLACTGPTGASLERPEERLGGTPIGRSPHPRSGLFSYRMGEVERSGPGVRVGFTLNNGTKRNYRSVALRVLLWGDTGDLRSVRLPIGAMAAEQSRALTARIPDVPFRVREVAIELLYAVP